MAVNHVLRGMHEYILIFSNGSFSRNIKNRESMISKGEFLEYTKSVWTFPTVSEKSIEHHAPFPCGLPKRLMRLFTFKNDIILYPFCRSGNNT